MNAGETPSSTPDADASCCPVCGSRKWIALPEVGPRSMASDWRVLDYPLRKQACAGCGLVAADKGSRKLAFERGYALYAHSPGAIAETVRQTTYASWIVGALDARTPSSVLDIGCGNGSLLRALRCHWPSAILMGCDPSSEAISYGTTTGLRLWEGTESDIPPTVRPDLIVTVNVLEHARDPRAFLAALAPRLATGGALVVICPDASSPGVELLMADHEYSFAPAHLDALIVGAGFEVQRSEAAPAALGAFRMVVASVADAAVQVAQAGAMAASLTPGLRPIEPVRAYLEQWASLDKRLNARVGDRSMVCFGTGEAAGLLRAYAPQLWSRVRACTADAIASPGRFGDLSTIPLADVNRDETVVLAVRPQDQLTLAARLRASFDHVVTWYDLLGNV